MDPSGLRGKPPTIKCLSARRMPVFTGSTSYVISYNMSKSIPMSLERAHALKLEMKKDPRLFAVNNLRIFGNSGAWRVDANMVGTGEAVRICCESEWESWLEASAKRKKKFASTTL